jgi:hypothetical protein
VADDFRLGHTAAVGVGQPPIQAHALKQHSGQEKHPANDEERRRCPETHEGEEQGRQHIHADFQIHTTECAEILIAAQPCPIAFDRFVKAKNGHDRQTAGQCLNRERRRHLHAFALPRKP